MKYETVPRFRREHQRLSARERSLFARAIRDVNAAYARNPSAWPPSWPAHLRIKLLQGTSGIWEMTWSFAGPDGRATFELVTIGDEPGILWRRIGGHEIFREP